MPFKICLKQGFDLWIRTLHEKGVEIMLLGNQASSPSCNSWINEFVIIMRNMYCLETCSQMKQQHYTHLYAELIRHIPQVGCGRGNETHFKKKKKKNEKNQTKLNSNQTKNANKQINPPPKQTSKKHKSKPKITTKIHTSFPGNLVFPSLCWGSQSWQ